MSDLLRDLVTDALQRLRFHSDTEARDWCAKAEAALRWSKRKPSPQKMKRGPPYRSPWEVRSERVLRYCWSSLLGRRTPRD